MIATGIGVDPGGPPELASHHHQGALQQSPLVQICEQRRHAAVEQWQQVVSQHLEVVVVGIPVGMVDRHAANASLDQASRHQAALTQ